MYVDDVVIVTVTRADGSTATFGRGGNGNLGPNISSVTITIAPSITPPITNSDEERRWWAAKVRERAALGGLQPGDNVTIRVYKRIQITYDVPKLFGIIRVPFSKKKEIQGNSRRCL